MFGSQVVFSFKISIEMFGIFISRKNSENTSTSIIDYNYFKRSEEHTSELQSRPHLVCRLLLEKKKGHPPVVARPAGNDGEHRAALLHEPPQAHLSPLVQCRFRGTLRFLSPVGYVHRRRPLQPA